jgi:hypothetical protein
LVSFFVVALTNDHKHSSLKNNNFARRWWLKPIIPATQEVEIKKIAV